MVTTPTSVGADQYLRQNAESADTPRIGTMTCVLNLIGARPMFEYLTLEAELDKAHALLKRTLSNGHFSWCAKNGQMPQVIGRAYTLGGPNCDWKRWRDSVACTCEVSALGFANDRGAE